MHILYVVFLNNALKQIVVIQKQIETFIALISPRHMSFYSNTFHAILYFVTTLHGKQWAFRRKETKRRVGVEASECAYPGSGVKQKGKHVFSWLRSSSTFRQLWPTTPQITAVVFKVEHPVSFGREQKDSQWLSLIKVNISWSRFKNLIKCYFVEP